MNTSFFFKIEKKEAEKMAVNFEILVVTTLQHACTKVQACKQNAYSRKGKDRTSGLSIPLYKMEG